MKIADMTLPDRARAVTSGHHGLSAIQGISTSAVSGVKMKPMAARCGSRLNNTDCAADTLANGSPMMNPWRTCSQ